MPDLSPGGFGDADFGQLGAEAAKQDAEEPALVENVEGTLDVANEQQIEDERGSPELVARTSSNNLAGLSATGTTAPDDDSGAEVDEFGDDDGDFEFDNIPAPATGPDEFGDFDDFGDFDEGDAVDTAGFEATEDQGEGFGQAASAGFVSEPQDMDDQAWEDPNRPAPPVSLSFPRRPSL